MTETPEQERTNPEPDPNHINTEHLRDYTQLRRSSHDRKIAGVAGGLGRHLNIDPVILRVLFVVLCFFGGAGFVLYGAAWLLVPEDTGKPATFRATDSTRNVLLIMAAVFSGLLLIGDSWGGYGFPWPLIVVAFVVFAFLMSRDNKASTWQPPAPPSSGEGGSVDPNAPAQYAASPTGATTGAGDQTVPLGQPYQYTGRQYGWQPVVPQPPAKPAKRGPILFGITLALVAAGFGILGIYDAVAGNFVPDAAYPALALAIIGSMLVVGSFYGRPGGLVFLGVIASVALAVTAVVDPRYDGDRTIDVAPASAAAVRSHYHVPSGEITVDLSKVDEVEGLDGRTIDLDATAGEIIVILPRDVGATVDARVDLAGAVDLPDHSEAGFGPDLSETIVVPDQKAHVVLDMDLDLGHIEVRQAA